ncbi:hypothetical protein, partial [Burkholderia cenocepacia]|uniref:hypothetical protein n=1 Tax=Burkholderia cenocepacia TaxID=95486 RepID=UPI001C6818A0
LDRYRSLVALLGEPRDFDDLAVSRTEGDLLILIQEHTKKAPQSDDLGRETDCGGNSQTTVVILR